MTGWSVAGNYSIGWKVVVGCTLCAVPLLVASSGCNFGPARVTPVNVDVDSVITELMSQLDNDKNGGLSRSELAAMPPLADCLTHCRRNSKDEISVEELTATLRRVFDPHTAVVSASCLVRYNGQPLSGANVRFVPLPVFKNKLPVGTGVTDGDGFAVIAASPEDLPKAAPKVALITPGLYLVEVTHPSKQIPEKYNRQTVIGREVSTDTVYKGKLGVDLKL